MGLLAPKERDLQALSLKETQVPEIIKQWAQTISYKVFRPAENGVSDAPGRESLKFRR